MVKKLIFVIFILFLPVAFAETEIFSGNIVTDADKYIEGAGTFRLKYDENTNKVFVQTPTTNIIVDNGDCKSNSVFRVCINRANFTDRNITTYVSYYEINLNIYKLTGSLTAASKSTQAELLPNEQAEFTITITNPTDFEITSIKYSENLAPFVLLEVKGCTIRDKNIEWQGFLKPKYDKTCTARISTDEPGTYTLTGNISYNNGFEIEKKTTDSVAINVLKRQLKADKILDNNIEVKQPFYLNVSVKNEHAKEKLEGTLTYTLPHNLKLLEYRGNIMKDSNSLKGNLLLLPGSFLNFSLYLEAESEGSSSIAEKYSYSMKNVAAVFENSTTILVIEPKPVINITAEYAEVKPGQKFIALAILKNPSRLYTLKNIKARLSVPFNEEIIQSLSQLLPNESYTIISNTFIVPDYLGPQQASMNLDVIVTYSLNDVTKSVQSILPVSIGNRFSSPASVPPAIPLETTPDSNQSEAKTETQAAPSNEEQNASSQSEAQQQVQVIEDKLEKRDFKKYFSDKTLWLVTGTIVILIFIVPILIYNFRKLKKQPPMQPRGAGQQQNTNQPKSF